MCVIKADSKLKVIPMMFLLCQKKKELKRESIMGEIEADRKGKEKYYSINLSSSEMIMGWLPGLSVL